MTAHVPRFMSFDRSSYKSKSSFLLCSNQVVLLTLFSPFQPKETNGVWDRLLESSSAQSNGRNVILSLVSLEIIQRLCLRGTHQASHMLGLLFMSFLLSVFSLVSMISDVFVCRISRRSLHVWEPPPPSPYLYVKRYLSYSGA